METFFSLNANDICSIDEVDFGDIAEIENIEAISVLRDTIKSMREEENQDKRISA